MSIQKIDLCNLPRQVNVHEDIHEKRSHIFLGTFAKQPTRKNFQRETIRELVVKANFESQDALYALGNVRIYTKQPLARYDWQVIKTTITALCSKLGTCPKTSLFLIVVVPATILMGFPLWASAALGLFTIDLFFRELLPVILQIQKMNQDRFVAFQNLSVGANSMTGFDVEDLVNKTDNGWEDLVTGDLLSLDQISNTQIIRIGSCALPIKSALQSMLISSYQGADYPRGMIPHPIEERPLTPEETDKFLSDVSAFFALKNTQQLKACWNLRVTIEEVIPYVHRIQSWDALIAADRTEALNNLGLQILFKKQKEAFLNLLTESIAQTYFDENFRSADIEIPIFYFCPIRPELSLQTIEAIVNMQSHGAPAA